MVQTILDFVILLLPSLKQPGLQDHAAWLGRKLLAVSASDLLLLRSLPLPEMPMNP